MGTSSRNVPRTNKLYSASSRFVTAARTLVPLTRDNVTKIGELRGPSFQGLTAAALVDTASKAMEAIESFMVWIVGEASEEIDAVEVVWLV